MKVYRSAVDGTYVTEAFAKENPDTTVSEDVHGYPPDMRDVAVLWLRHNQAKIDRITPLAPGMSTSIVKGSIFLIRYSTEAWEEAVIIGQPPRRVPVAETAEQTEARLQRKQIEAIKARDERRPPRRIRSGDSFAIDPVIDLTNDQVDQVLACWRRGEKAIGQLKFAKAPK